MDTEEVALIRRLENQVDKLISRVEGVTRMVESQEFPYSEEALHGAREFAKTTIRLHMQAYLLSTTLRRMRDD